MTKPSVPQASPPGASKAAPAAGGRAGVPVSIWPAIPAPAPCPASTHPVPCPHRLDAQAGRQVITALSRPGDLVVIPEPATGALAVAAAAAGRRVLALAATTGQGQDLAARLDHDLAPAHRPLARVHADGPPQLLRAASPEAGQAALVLTTACPTPGCPPPAPAGNTAGLGTGAGVLYAACQRVLAPTGLLVIITNAARRPGHPGDLIAHARAAGLVYTQHIIAVHARIRGSHLITAVTGQPGTSGYHLPIHTDLLVFTQGETR